MLHQLHKSPADAGASSVSRALKHVAVFSFPFASHGHHLLAVVRRLSAHSPPTTTFSFFGTEKSNASLFPALSDVSSSIDAYSLNIRPFNVHDGVPEGYTPTIDPRRVGVQLEPVDLFMKAAPESFRRALEAAEDAVGCPITCVLSDAFLWIGADLATERGVPWVAIRSGGPRSILAFVETDQIRSTFGTGIGCEDKVLDFIPGLGKTKCKDLPDGILFGNRNSPFPRMLHNMGKTLHRAAAVAVNCFEEADPVVNEYLRSKFHNYLPIGLSSQASAPPFSDPDSCIPWLDQYEQQNSVVYISFGTVAKPKPDELKALLEALIETGHPFLLSYRGNLSENNFPGELVEKALERGKVVPWAPQLAVLRHRSVGAFVTHCGWTSLMESILSGVPMIVRPFFGDQTLYRILLDSEWKIGVSTEGGMFTKQGTVRAVDMIMSGEEGQRMRERVGVLKEAALRSMEPPNGSSYRNFNALLEIVNK